MAPSTLPLFRWFYHQTMRNFSIDNHTPPRAIQDLGQGVTQTLTHCHSASYGKSSFTDRTWQDSFFSVDLYLFRIRSVSFSPNICKNPSSLKCRRRREDLNTSRSVAVAWAVSETNECYNLGLITALATMLLLLLPLCTSSTLSQCFVMVFR